MPGLRIFTAAWLHGLRVAIVVVAVAVVIGLHLAAIAAIPMALLAFIAPQWLGPVASGLGLLAAALAIPVALGFAAQTDGPRLEAVEAEVTPLYPVVHLSVIEGQARGAPTEPDAELALAGAPGAAGSPSRRRRWRRRLGLAGGR